MITKIQSTSITPPNVPQPQTKPSFMKRYKDDDDSVEYGDKSTELVDDLREQNREMRKISKEGGAVAILSKGVLAAGTGAVAMITASLGWKSIGATFSSMAKSGTIKGLLADFSKLTGSVKKYSKEAVNFVKNLSFVKKASNEVSDFIKTNTICVKIKKNKTISGIISTVKNSVSKTKAAIKEFFKAPKQIETPKSVDPLKPNEEVEEVHSKAYDYSKKIFTVASGGAGVAEGLGINTTNQEAAK